VREKVNALIVNKLYIILYYIELQDYNICKTFPKKIEILVNLYHFVTKHISRVTGETLTYINYKFNFFFGTSIDFFLEIESLARPPRLSRTLLFWLD